MSWAQDIAGLAEAVETTFSTERIILKPKSGVPNQVVIEKAVKIDPLRVGAKVNSAFTIRQVRLSRFADAGYYPVKGDVVTLEDGFDYTIDTPHYPNSGCVRLVLTRRKGA